MTSKLPLKRCGEDNHHIMDADGYAVCDMADKYSSLSGADMDDMAKLIVESVNNAEALKTRVAELEKLLLMIAERGELDFDEEGWTFYDKIMKPLPNIEEKEPDYMQTHCTDQTEKDNY